MTTQELQQHWPEWEIIRPLGEGAFGKVYEIRRSADGFEEHAALKVIHIPQSESEVKYLISEGADEASVSAHFRELAGQLSNEIATQAKLKGNSNIVSYEDRKIVPDPDGVGYTILIRMELLTSLLDHMTARPMSRDDVLQLGLDMSKALLLCERHHIIHRDIKLQNIFISPNGDYKLGDFGVARELEKTTSNLSRKGTYNYMAPEVFHGRPGNATVDIYSLGIVLYTLLNGNRAPFLPPPPAPLPNAREREAAQGKRLSGEALPPLEGVPAALNDLILKMCAFEPKSRYQNARELIEAMENAAYELHTDKTVGLFSWIGDNTPGVAPPMDATADDEGSRWIDGTPVAKQPEPEPEPSMPVPKKSASKPLIAVLAGAVVVLVVAVVWMALRNRPEPVLDAGGGTSTAASDVTTAHDENPDVANWHVEVQGIPDVLSFTNLDILHLSKVEIEMTTTNNSGFTVTSKYGGVTLRSILNLFDVQDVSSVTVFSSEGSSVVYPQSVAMAEDTLLAWEIDGAPIDAKQPLRMCPRSGSADMYVRSVTGIRVDFAITGTTTASATTNTTKPTTTKATTATKKPTANPQEGIIELSDYFKSDGKGFNIRASELAKTLDCPVHEHFPDLYDTYTSSITEPYPLITIFAFYPVSNDQVNAVFCTTTSLSVYGVRVGDSPAKAKQNWENENLTPYYDRGESPYTYMEYMNEEGLHLCASFSEDKIYRIDVMWNW